MYKVEEVFLVNENVKEIRIYPISPFCYPTEEYAKLCILNGLENYTSFHDLGNNSLLNLYSKSLFFFQYSGGIVAKAMVYVKSELYPYEHFFYYTDEIEVLEEPITAKELKGVWKEFKKFNSVAQKIPIKYLLPILRLFDEKKKMDNIILGENDSFFLDLKEGKKISYYVTKYERNPKYRELAIKIHGLTCQICGFNFEKMYGELGRGYIEVHHKKPLFSLKDEIIPNPETDMICVCSNCHRMLHRKKCSILTDEEIKKSLNNVNNKRKNV